MYLTVEGIRGETNPGISYAVYLGDVVEEKLAGLISFFGIDGTADGDHALAFTFDVTDIVGALRDEDEWDPADVRVVFELVGPVLDAEEEGEDEDEAERPPVDVGTFTIAYQ